MFLLTNYLKKLKLTPYIELINIQVVIKGLTVAI